MLHKCVSLVLVGLFGLIFRVSAFAPYHGIAPINTRAPNSLPQKKSISYVRRDRIRAGPLNMWSNDDEIQGQDRIKACIPYLLPLVDGHHFAKYINLRFPPLAAIDSITIAPLADLVESVPFLSLILFLVLSLGTRGANLSRPVKFNAQQAVLIDVALVFPELFGAAFEGQRAFVPLMEPASNFVFYFYMGCVIYSVSSNLQGKTPNQIPFISNAANMATGPY